MFPVNPAITAGYQTTGKSTNFSVYKWIWSNRKETVERKYMTFRLQQRNESAIFKHYVQVRQHRQNVHMHSVRKTMETNITISACRVPLFLFDHKSLIKLQLKLEPVHNHSQCCVLACKQSTLERIPLGNLAMGHMRVSEALHSCCRSTCEEWMTTAAHDHCYVLKMKSPALGDLMDISRLQSIITYPLPIRDQMTFTPCSCGRRQLTNSHSADLHSVQRWHETMACAPHRVGKTTLVEHKFTCKYKYLHACHEVPPFR